MSGTSGRKMEPMDGMIEPMDQVEDWFERLLKVREEHLELHRKLNKIN
jgi:hypothetical protein